MRAFQMLDKKRLYKLGLYEIGRENFDDAITYFYVVAKKDDEAISKGKQAFQNKAYTVKIIEQLITYCECEVDGVFIDTSIG